MTVERKIISSAVAGFLFVCSEWVLMEFEWLRDYVIKDNKVYELINVGGAIGYSFIFILICLTKINLFITKVGSVFSNHGECKTYQNRREYACWVILTLAINSFVVVTLGMLSRLIMDGTDFIDIIDNFVNIKLNVKDVNDYIYLFMQAFIYGTFIQFIISASTIFSLVSLMILFLVGYERYDCALTSLLYFSALYPQYDIKMLAVIAITLLGNILGTIPMVLLFNVIHSRSRSTHNSQNVNQNINGQNVNQIINDQNFNQNINGQNIGDQNICDQNVNQNINRQNVNDPTVQNNTSDQTPTQDYELETISYNQHEPQYPYVPSINTLYDSIDPAQPSAQHQPSRLSNVTLINPLLDQSDSYYTF